MSLALLMGMIRPRALVALLLVACITMSGCVFGFGKQSRRVATGINVGLAGVGTGLVIYGTRQHNQEAERCDAAKEQNPRSACLNFAGLKETAAGAIVLSSAAAGLLLTLIIMEAQKARDTRRAPATTQDLALADALRRGADEPLAAAVSLDQ